MRVVWTVPALRELRGAEAYLAERDHRAAARTIGRIEAVAARLDRSQFIGRPARERDVRKLVVSGTRYILTHRVHEDEVLILALFAERQQRPTSFLRTPS